MQHHEVIFDLYADNNHWFQPCAKSDTLDTRADTLHWLEVCTEKIQKWIPLDNYSLDS